MTTSEKLAQAADLIESALADSPVYGVTVEDFQSAGRWSNSEGTADITGRNLADALRQKAKESEPRTTVTA